MRTFGVITIIKCISPFVFLYLASLKKCMNVNEDCKGELSCSNMGFTQVEGLWYQAMSYQGTKVTVSIPSLCRFTRACIIILSDCVFEFHAQSKSHAQISSMMPHIHPQFLCRNKIKITTSLRYLPWSPPTRCRELRIDLPHQPSISSCP